MARAASATEVDAIAGANAAALLRSMSDGRPGRGAIQNPAPSTAPLRTLTAAWKKWQAIDGGRLAAALAFYSMLSLAPFLILFVAVGNWWLGTDTATHYLSSQMANLIGPGGARLVDRLAQSRDVPLGAHRWGASIGSVIAIVGATAVYAELQYALNRIFGAAEGPAMLVLLRARALSFGLVLATGLLLIVSLTLSVGMATLVDHETRILGIGVSTMVNEGITFAVITIAFAVILRVLPDQAPHGRDAWFGAVVSASLFAVSKFAVGAYVLHYAVNSMYGAVGTVVAIMLWIYFTAATFLAGAVITSVRMLRAGSD